MIGRNSTVISGSVRSRRFEDAAPDDGAPGPAGHVLDHQVSAIAAEDRRPSRRVYATR